MRTIIHLSDLHIGKTKNRTIQPLIDAINKLNPDLVVVSGDLTQLALASQFKAAANFLKEIPKPQIVVPGNHDVPLIDPVSRFGFPFALFKRYITKDLYPFYKDDEIAVIGVNTARSFHTKYGRLNAAQIHLLKDRLCPLPDDMIKIVVTHHPFDLPKGYRDYKQLVGRSQMAMKVLAECGADMFLAGHLHMVYTGDTAARYMIEGHAALIVQAGTATSRHSAKSEANSFNLIRCESQKIVVERFEWSEESHKFHKSLEDAFQHSDSGWKRIPT